MSLFSNLFHGYFYIVDSATLKKYLSNELNFSLENKLEASANLNIYLNGEKHHIQIFNYGESNFKNEQEKGLIFYYDNEEFKTLDELWNLRLSYLPEFFKIELIDSDNAALNKYKDEHPELNIENY